MAFSTNNSSSNILNRILSNLPSNVDSSEGSFLYDSVSPIASELASAYVALDTYFNNVFITTSAGIYMDNRAAEFGLIRIIGIAAAGQVTFTGTNNTAIPKGTIVQTSSGLQYLTSATATITSGSVIVNIIASAIGSSYNVPTNVITTLPVQINGITSVTNSIAITNGVDTETDAAFLARFLIFVQTPATSGNAAHYKQWAQQVSGIGSTQVYPLWAGAGTIKVCAIDVNSQPLSSALLTNLSTYIEANRPIGAMVTYETATSLPINIAVKITLSSGYTNTQIQTALTSSITNYLASIAFNQSTVSYAKIGSLIIGTIGVADYSNLTINTGSINITIPQEQVAILGTITITN